MQFRNSIPKLHKNNQYPKYLLIFYKKSREFPAFRLTSFLFSFFKILKGIKA